MEVRNEDETRLLRSSTSSINDLESHGGNHTSPYISAVDSVDNPDSPILSEYKRRTPRRRHWSLTQKAFGACSNPRAIRYVLAFCGFLLFLVLGYGIWHKKETFVVSKYAFKQEPMVELTKPEGFKIVALVFYGRPPVVTILDCYLKRNLVANGGFLDEVHWMANTDSKPALKLLDEIVDSTAEYKKFRLDDLGYQSIWQHAVDPNTLYIKIDDDIVYIHDDAIPRMVHTRLNHPEAYDIAANIVNSPTMNWLHYHLGAIYPYLPEPTSPTNYNGNLNKEWRPSLLPEYEGSAPDEYDFGKKREGQVEYEIGQTGGPTYEGHRWLPLKNTSENLKKTPIAKTSYDVWGRALTSWAINAQQQYSLLDNLEQDTMDKYWFGNSQGIWNMQYERYNLNFLAIWGKDVAAKPPGSEDEQELTVDFPKLFKKPLLIDSHAIVAHYSFGAQTEIRKTDVLSRYRAYANEKICGPKNQLEYIPWN